MAQAAPASSAATTKAWPSRFGPRMATKPSPLPRLRLSMEKPVTGGVPTPRHVPPVALRISPMVQSGSATSRLLFQRGSHRVVVGKGDDGRPHGLTGLVAFASDEQHIAPFEPDDGLGNRRS